MRSVRFLLFFSLTMCVIGCSSDQSLIIPNQLRVEYLENPVGIDRSQPNLSWKLSSNEPGAFQSAYQIIVASDSTLLNLTEADLWNSGKVISNQQFNIFYKGGILEGSRSYYWKVKVWDQENRKGKWSKLGFWSRGPLIEKDWSAEWISHKPDTKETDAIALREQKRASQVEEDSMAVYFRKSLKVEKAVKNVQLFVSGLGYHEIYLNGDKINDRVMDPVFTDYNKTVKYTGYDVTSFLQQDLNTIGVLLGNGFYNLTEPDLFQMEKASWKKPKKMCLSLVIYYDDGTQSKVGSDTSWKWSYGPITYNSIRGGETIDAAIELKDWTQPYFNDQDWKPVTKVSKSKGELHYQYMPPMREVNSITPITSWSPKPGVLVYDFGENLTGYADIEVKGARSSKVAIDFNEVLNPDSTLNVKHSSGHTWGRFQHGVLILSDQGSGVYKPRFTYHGFRYVQLTGIHQIEEVAEIAAKSVHTDLESIGSFECSNPRLNQLHSAVRKTLLNSIHSMPGEEPTREKMGWTLDAGMVTMQSYLYNFDALSTYKKYLQDMIDAREPSGHIPPIVPTNGWGTLTKNKAGKDTTIVYDDPWWGGTIAFVADQLFQFTGDTSIIEMAYEPVRSYTDFVASTAQNNLVYWSLGDWLDMNQWANGWGPGLTPIVQTSTAANFYLHDRTAKFARLLGKEREVKIYRDRANEIKTSFNNTFLQNDGWYAENSQTAQVLPLYLNLVPANKKEQVVDKLLLAVATNDFHTNVGFVGVNPLISYLSENGYLADVYTMVTQEKSPGWLHFVENEKSTLGENLNAQGYGTNHHPFASVVGFWFYKYLAGIKVDFTKEYEIVLTPGIQTPLEWVECSYETLKGRVESSWKKEGNKVIYHVSVPLNTKAKIVLPESAKNVSLNDYEVALRENELILTPGAHQIIVEL